MPRVLDHINEGNYIFIKDSQRVARVISLEKRTIKGNTRTLLNLWYPIINEREIKHPDTIDFHKIKNLSRELHRLQKIEITHIVEQALKLRLATKKERALKIRNLELNINGDIPNKSIGRYISNAIREGKTRIQAIPTITEAPHVSGRAYWLGEER